MTFYERIESLRKSRGISQGDLEKELGFSNGSISKWKNSMPTIKRLQKLADYFEVTIGYLMDGEEKSEQQENILTAKDERDIAKDLDNIMKKLSNNENGPASFEGTDIPEADQEMFSGQLELMLRRLKSINKDLYNPTKNKK